jgi:hypothetical protein
MIFIPVVNSEIPEAPMQMILVITENYRRYKILARFVPNLTEKIASYKRVIRG